MKNTIEALQLILADFTPKIASIPDSEFSSIPAPGKWSKKEIVGHLTDSAHNNLRRFIAGQYESSPHIVYDQDFWVKANDYAGVSKNEVIESWRLTNSSICRVLRTMPVANYSKTCNTGKTEQQLRTLQWLAEDYVKHMKHHLNQIFPGTFDIVYPS